jgi:hypothetical protein
MTSGLRPVFVVRAITLRGARAICACVHTLAPANRDAASTRAARGVGSADTTRQQPAAAAVRARSSDNDE